MVSLRHRPTETQPAVLRDKHTQNHGEIHTCMSAHTQREAHKERGTKLGFQGLFDFNPETWAPARLAVDRMRLRKKGKR